MTSLATPRDVATAPPVLPFCLATPATGPHTAATCLPFTTVTGRCGTYPATAAICAWSTGPATPWTNPCHIRIHRCICATILHGSPNPCTVTCTPGSVGPIHRPDALGPHRSHDSSVPVPGLIPSQANVACHRPFRRLRPGATRICLCSCPVHDLYVLCHGPYATHHAGRATSPHSLYAIGHNAHITCCDAAIHGPAPPPWPLSYGLAAPLAHILATSPPSSDALRAWLASRLDPSSDTPRHAQQPSHHCTPQSSCAHAARPTASNSPHTVPLCLRGMTPASLAPSTVALMPSEMVGGPRTSHSHLVPAAAPMHARPDPPDFPATLALLTAPTMRAFAHPASFAPMPAPITAPSPTAHAFSGSSTTHHAFTTPGAHLLTGTCRTAPCSPCVPALALQPCLSTASATAPPASPTVGTTSMAPTALSVTPCAHLTLTSPTPRAVLVGDCIDWVTSHIDSCHCCLGAHTSRTTASVPRPRGAAPTLCH